MHRIKTSTRSRLPLPLYGLFAVALLLSATPTWSNSGKDELLGKMFLKSLRSWHYQPVELDQDFSEKTFDFYLKRLDPQKRFLLQSDVDALRKHRMGLNDELNRGALDFVDVVTEVSEKRLREVKALTSKLLAKPLDFKLNDTLELDSDKIKFPANLAERERRWSRLLKFQVLTRIHNAQESPDSAKAAQAGKDFEALEKESREQVLRNVHRTLDRMLGEDRSRRVATYLNAAANVFDPHTQYMPPQAREDFDLSMTGTLEGIGAILREEDGFIRVVSIVPGSASWRQKELKAEDKILKVAQGREEAVDIVDMSVNDAVRLIRGQKGTEVRLTVQKPGGQIIVIPIVRDVVVVEETFAKSAVLQKKNDKGKWGYVELPTFYHDFSRKDGRNSSDDVRKEIDKLKKEGIDGLVLDLRNNGGGALEDAVKLTGLFIETGPVVQVKDRRGRSRVLADEDEDIAWAGPLVVMVNSFSASASEIVAAALQDYGRALVVGADTTFGKGTVQSMIDLDTYLPPLFSPFRPMGSLKLTIQKFYRINGGSTQYRGVVPDILIPDAYTDLDLGEKKLDNAMTWDQAERADYVRWEKVLDAPALRLSHKTRADKSEIYQSHMRQFQAMKSRRDETRVVLQKDDFFRTQKAAKAESKAFEDLNKKELPLVVSQREANKALLPEEVEIRNNWEVELKRDLHLYKVTHILGDMLTQTEAKSAKVDKSAREDALVH